MNSSVKMIAIENCIANTSCRLSYRFFYKGGRGRKDYLNNFRGAKL